MKRRAIEIDGASNNSTVQPLLLLLLETRRELRRRAHSSSLCLPTRLQGIERRIVYNNNSIILSIGCSSSYFVAVDAAVNILELLSLSLSLSRVLFCRVKRSTGV